MWKIRLATFVPLFFIFVFGAFLRFYNLNWDTFSMFHPDERNIANAVTQIRFFSQLNPRFFAYGGFSIYLYRATGELLVFLTKDTSWVENWGYINIIGRFYSALFSLLTVIPLYFLTRKLWNTSVAILASSCFIFCVSSIQMAHFAVTESLITLQGVSIALLSVWFFEKPKIYKAFLIGVLFGIALATKTSTGLFGIMPFLSFIFSYKRKSWKSLLVSLLIFSFFSGVFFFVFSPYTILDYQHFLESMHYESGVATGSIPVVYTLQFNHTLPYLFQIYNFIWQIGILTPFAIIGMLVLIFQARDKKAISLRIILAFVIIYFFYVGSWHTKFIRYMMPVIPYFIIAGSVFLISIKEKYNKLGNILITIVVLGTNLWAVAFFNIYTLPQTRVSASVWIYNHIPAGSHIFTEHWDDGLPIGIGAYNPTIYTSQALTIYDTDNAAKLEYYAQTLPQADYIIINSRRLYGTLIHLTDMYPLTSRYYTNLFSGKLGFKEVATFTSYPSLLGITINDDASEETFQVYDHPKVRIFRNEKHLTSEDIKKILQ